MTVEWTAPELYESGFLHHFSSKTVEKGSEYSKHALTSVFTSSTLFQGAKANTDVFHPS